jgi:tetratricopeptide (TPR) repeat protein
LFAIYDRVTSKDNDEMKRLIPKDISTDTITTIAIFFIAIFMGGFFGSYYGIRYWNNGIAGAIVGILIGCFAFLVGRTIMNLILKTAIPLTGKRAARWTTREQLEGELNQANYYKRKEDFQKALKTVNRIIDMDPNFPEALYLKAQILWEGFENHGGAQSYLKKIIEVANDKDTTIRRWAISLSEEIDSVKDRCEHYKVKG